MFTVIMLRDSERAIFEPARVYFEPFEEAGVIGFARWNQSERALRMEDALPDLREIIKGKKNWRAVVVDHPRSSTPSSPAGERDDENPFDFLDNQQVALSLAHSKQAVIRLAHLLLGYPQMSAREFEPYFQYQHSDSGAVIQGDPKQLVLDFLRESSPGAELEYEGVEYDNEQWFSLAMAKISPVHHHVRRLFHETKYSAEEVQRHRELSEHYAMKEVRPSEVVFIATRAGMLEDDKALLKRAWKTGQEQNASRFVERNDYPPMSRFATYELLEEENSGYEEDLLRFWLGVLTVAQNLMPPGGFQAERLYLMSIQFDPARLGDTFNAHISQLAMVRDHLERLIEAPVRPIDLQSEDVLTPVEVNVVFDGIGQHLLEAPLSGWGLASDRPQDEGRRWASEMKRISAEASLFVKRPRRMVARAVFSARELVGMRQGEPLSLTQFEREDLDERLARQLRALVVPATSELLNEDRLQRIIAQSDEHVRHRILQRMKSPTIWMSSLLGLGIWLAAFLPYLIQSWGAGADALVAGLFVTVAVLGCIAATGLVTLIVFRMLLRARMIEFNRRTKQEVDAVRSGGLRFSDFLSQYVTYRRGAARLRGASQASELRQARLRRLRRLRDRVVRHIDDEKRIVQILDVPLEVHRTSKGLVDFDPDDQRMERMLFRLPVGDGLVPFNESGEHIAAPYDFITEFSLSRLMLFEHSESSDTLERGATQ